LKDESEFPSHTRQRVEVVVGGWVISRQKNDYLGAPGSANWVAGLRERKQN
jgi:hypothetical protein